MGVSFVLTPPMERLALRTSFLDHPVGYKQHPRATPYLGGAAVIGGFLAGSSMLAFVGATGTVGLVVAGTVALWALGTVDDRVGLPILSRLAAQAAVAVAFWAADAGWDVGAGGALDLALTIAWVVGLVNAFNLMDNIDGAVTAVGTVSGAGAGGLALLEGEPELAVLAFSLAGACVGFLPRNLGQPSRIFLGDGGSMPVGFVIATVIMAVPHGDLGISALLAAAPLVGLPIFDVALVIVSRHRRGVPLVHGGRDHLTHRLHARLHTAAAVALAVAAAQFALAGLGLAMNRLGTAPVLLIAAGYLAAGAVALVTLDRGAWRPSDAWRA